MKLKSYLQGYTCFAKCRDSGLHGGICVLVKEQLSQGIKRICKYCEDTVSLVFDKNHFSLMKDMVMIFTYVSPAGSSIYRNADYTNGIDRLESCLIDVLNIFDDDPYILIAGDLNARTGELDDFLLYDGDNSQTSLDIWYKADTFNQQRRNSDSDTNLYGLALVDLCCTFGIHILNGRFSSDPAGDFTCITNNGVSVADYMLVNTELFALIEEFSVQSRTESDHLPIHCKIKFDHIVNLFPEQDLLVYNRYFWEPDKAGEFVAILQNAECQEKLITIDDDIYRDVNLGVETLTEVLTSAAKCMKCTTYGPRTNVKQHSSWFDIECRAKKDEKLEKLNQFRVTHSDVDFSEYKKARSEFKVLCRDKKSAWNEAQRNKVSTLKENSCKCWSFMKKSSSSPYSSNPISPDAWYNYFKSLFVANPMKSTIEEQITQDLNAHEEYCNLCLINNPEDLNKPVDREEILGALKEMADNKAPGICTYILHPFCTHSAWLLLWLGNENCGGMSQLQPEQKAHCQLPSRA